MSKRPKQVEQVTRTVWVDKLGVRHPVRELSDKYLINVVLYLRETGEPTKYATWDRLCREVRRRGLEKAAFGKLSA